MNNKLENTNINIITNQGYNTGIGRAAIETYRALKPILKNIKLYSINYFDNFTISGSIQLSNVFAKKAISVPLVNYKNIKKIKKINMFKNKNIHLMGSDYSLVTESNKNILTIHEFYYVKNIFQSHSLMGLAGDLTYNYEELKIKKYIKNANGIICPSNYSANQISNKLKVIPKVVPFSIDKSVYRPRNKNSIREMLNLPKNKKFLINVSGSGINKNLKTLEKLADILPDDYILLKINAPLKSKKALNLGFVKYDQYPFYLSAADIYVHMSTKEGFGFPLVESMATGLPIISNKSSTAPEILGKYHLFTEDPYDYNEYLYNINSCYESYKYYSNISIERSKIFSDENFRDKILPLYEDVYL